MHQNAGFTESFVKRKKKCQEFTTYVHIFNKNEDPIWTITFEKYVPLLSRIFLIYFTLLL